MKRITITLQFLFQFLQRHWLFICFFLLLGIHIFFQFYNMYAWTPFGWDQTDNAWAAKRILIDHQYPLVGMVAKENTGFYIGPLYYYYISIFYWMTKMHPIASSLTAGVTSIITFFVFFFLIRKLFSTKIALIAVGIETFSLFVISGDRTQWPVNFIPLISLLIFYALYKVVSGNPKYLLLLGLGVGLSLQIHFTSVFYFPIILLSLPLFPLRKRTFIYGFLSCILIFLFFLPNLIANLQAHNSQGSNLANYLHTYYLGFHLRHVLQLTHDGFIEFFAILRFHLADTLSWIFLPIFSVLYIRKQKDSNSKKLVYLSWLWVIIPWFAFSTYSGELSNYYFYMTRPIALIVFAYLTYMLLIQRYLLVKLCVIGFWMYFIYTNSLDFVHPPNNGLRDAEKSAKSHIISNTPILLYQNIPDSYLYWYYTYAHIQP